MCKIDGKVRQINENDAPLFHASILRYAIDRHSSPCLALHHDGVRRKDVFTKDLEEFLDIKGPSVTSLVNNLVRGGYLRRETIAGDGRFKKLILTDKALKMQTDITSRITCYMHSVFYGIARGGSAGIRNGHPENDRKHPVNFLPI